MERKISFLPERFREALTVANMTQKELASKVGVSVSSVRRYMSGAPIAQSRVRADISRVLNVNVAWLTGRSDSKERTPAQQHLDNVKDVMSALRKDARLLKAVDAMCKSEELPSVVGVPAMEPIEIRKEKAKAE